MTYGLFYQDIPVFAFDDNVQIEQLRFIRRILAKWTSISLTKVVSRHPQEQGGTPAQYDLFKEADKLQGFSRKYMVGVLHFSELQNKTWWKENNTSLIVMPGAAIEDIDIRDVKKKSLELAGIL